MVELRNAIIGSNKKNTSPVDISFAEGMINYLPYSQKNVFDFLISKEKYLEEGNFVIDGISFIPYDEKSDKTLIFLSINSQNISLTTCFVSDKKEKKETFEKIQNRLVALKELPLVTSEEKLHKISLIFEALYLEKVSFVLIDENNDTVASNLDLIKQLLPEFASKTPVIYLEKEISVIEDVIEEEVEELDDFFELSIGGSTSTEEKKSKKVKAKKTNNKSPVANGKDGYLLFGYKLKSPETPLTRLLNYLYRNLIVLFFLTVSIAGFMLTLLLSAQYFNIKNSMLGIMFIALGVVFIGLYIYNIYSCFDFIKFNDGAVYKRKFKYLTISNTLIILIGAGLALLLYNIFVSTTEDFVPEVYNLPQLIVVIVVLAIVILLPLFIKQVYKLFRFLGKKLSED